MTGHPGEGLCPNEAWAGTWNMKFPSWDRLAMSHIFCWTRGIENN